MGNEVTRFHTPNHERAFRGIPDFAVEAALILRYAKKKKKSTERDIFSIVYCVVLNKPKQAGFTIPPYLQHFTNKFPEEERGYLLIHILYKQNDLQ